MSKSIAVISLGCDKNRIDTERMLYYLGSGDYTVTQDESSAEIIIVNTCAFIEAARREAIDVILGAARFKSEGKCEKLIVTGCLPEKYRSELIEGLPEVDAFLGVNEYEKIRSVIEGGSVLAAGSGRVLTTPPHYAFLRIADGCDNFCTFCTIPSIRGRYRSVPMESLLSEADGLLGGGVKELILVAQDVTNYGADLYGKPRLTDLVRELAKRDFYLIRLMYCYPELVTDELIDLIASTPNVAKYLDVPMQHVSDAVLKRMNRRSRYAELCALTEKLTRRGIKLRTTFMVGFPGETEDDFARLVDFVKEYKPYNVGIFAYSKEAGTPSVKLKGQLPKAEKSRRVRILGETHLANVRERNATAVGQIVDVIYEDVDYDRAMFVGRTQYDAPDIDGVVRFSGEFADVGHVYKVRVTGYDDYDLIGEMTE